jgi:hypothetical protein
LSSSSGNDISRYLYLARSLASFVPAIVQPQVQSLLLHLWPSLRDPRVSLRAPSTWRSQSDLTLRTLHQLLLRERAASLLSVLCQIHQGSTALASKDSQSRFVIYDKLLAEAEGGFATGTVESVHGSMLVCQALFDYGEMVRGDCSLVYALA